MFAEPWQAQAFALAVKLSEQGHFTWKEWAAALADELQAAAERGEPDDGSRYYEHWLAALERLVTAKGLADPAALVARKEAWADAYRNTPHGQPVELLQSRERPTRAGFSSGSRPRSRPTGCFSRRVWSRREANWSRRDPAGRIRRERRPRRAARHAARARAGSSRRRVDPHDRRAQQREGRVARRVLGTGAYADVADGRRPAGGVAGRDAGDRGAGVRARRGPAVGRLRRARDLSGRYASARRSDALPRKTTSVLTLVASTAGRSHDHSWWAPCTDWRAAAR